MNRHLLLCGLLAGLSLPGPATAETTHCTPITTLPATISQQGLYCLAQDFSTSATSGNAITINTNNVTIDCNDRRLGGLAAGAGTVANGIHASGRANITVRNCQVRGFRYGISLHGSGHTVEDNRLDGNTTIGIYVGGEGSVVRGNRVRETGGNAAHTGPKGIRTVDNVDIIDNTVTGVVATAGSGESAWGIDTWKNHRGVIAGNRIRGVRADGSAPAHGISNSVSGRISLVENRIINAGPANIASSAMSCSDADGIATGNHVNGYAGGIKYCTDGGRNTVVLSP